MCDWYMIVNWCLGSGNEDVMKNTEVCLEQLPPFSGITAQRVQLQNPDDGEKFLSKVAKAVLSSMLKLLQSLVQNG